MLRFVCNPADEKQRISSICVKKPWFLATHCSPPSWSGGQTRSLSILRPPTVCSYALAVNPPVRRDPDTRGARSQSRPCAFHPPVGSPPSEDTSLASNKDTQNSPSSLSAWPIWIASAIADGPSRVGTLSRDRCLCRVHGCAMEQQPPTCAAESARCAWER